MTTWLLTLLLATAAPPEAKVDPRIELVELQLDRDLEGALARTRELILQGPEDSDRLGLSYLEGHLLELLDSPQEAAQAFVNALTGPPALRPHARLRLALLQERLGHPEVAAGLVATLLSDRGASRELLLPAARLLRRTVEAGGDCRLVAGLGGTALPRAPRREVMLSRARCALTDERTEEARSLLLTLLRESRSDEPARVAADLLVELGEPNPGMPRLIGLTFHDHREFVLADHYLGQAVQERSNRRGDAHFEAQYSLARAHFWLGRFESAALRFASLAKTGARPVQRAQSRFQEARCYELTGRWDEAATAYRKALDEDPRGSWSGAALMAELRLHRLAGNEADADELLTRLGTRTGWRKHHARAALFLAVSDLSEGRYDRADGWLELAARGDRVPLVESSYWKGRAAALRGEPQRALGLYTESIAADPYHPLAQAARRELEGDPAAVAFARDLSHRNDPDALYRAWLLLGTAHPRGRAARDELVARLRRDPAAAELLDFQPLAPADWPLWSEPLLQADEMLLSLGIVGEGASAVQKLFPIRDPTLALTGSHLLAQGGESRRSLYVAEILGKRRPKDFPEPLVPAEVQRLEYPFAYGYVLLREGRRRDVDPHLLAAIVREESRFDPTAVSAAAARGLAQFVLPTAREVGPQIGLDDPSPSDLHRPEVSLALGAAYLANLEERYDGREELAVAAYNAGEAQAELWRHYCSTDDPAEYFSKVGFRETRGYLQKVLSSRDRYHELYPEPASQPPADVE